MRDRYENFARLRNGETEGIDYRICIMERESFAAIIAPHGGRIEPGTSEIAAAIAENIHCLYCFEGLRERPHRDLHIKSTSFDEPKCLGLTKQCKIVVAVHGWDRKDKAVDVGGLDVALRDAICTRLDAAGFQSNVETKGRHAAISPNNVCNKGLREKGVQLEITKGLREALLRYEEDLRSFAKSVQQAISSQRPC